MEKHSMLILQIGKEITERTRVPEDYWIIYVNNGSLDICVRTESWHSVAGQIGIISLTNKEISFAPSNDFDGYVLQVNDPVSAELVQRYLLFMNSAGASVTVLTAGRQEKSIQTVFRNMLAEMSADGEGKDAIQELLFQELLVRLYRTNPQRLSAAYTDKSALVVGVRDLLEKQYYNPLTLETIAGEFNMSVSYLSHIFKEITGVSVMRCLLLIRVRAAQRHLEQTDLPVNEIAEKCGFNDVSNFGRTFRKETGCSPSQYRHRQRSIQLQKKNPEQ